MRTRFTPSLESLGARLTPSTWNPTTSQTRQITIVQELAPPGDDFGLLLETLDENGKLGSTQVTGRITGVAVDPLSEGPATLEGKECLVFFLGAVPSESLPNDWVFGTELPKAHSSELQGWLLIAKQQAGDGDPGLTEEPSVARINPNLIDADFNFDAVDSPHTSSAAGDGRAYKMLFAPLVIDLDNRGDTRDASAPTILLQRLANPTIPDAGTHVLYQDIVIPPQAGGSEGPFVFAQDPRSTGASAGDAYYGTGVYKSIDSGHTW